MEKRVLIRRWLGTEVQAIPIYDEASVSSARQRVREIGDTLNFRKEFVEKVVLIASELAHNQLSYATQGYFSVKPITRDGVNGLEILAADIGPGIDKPARALQGASSRETSLGAGLSAVCRISDEVEFDDRISEGFLVTARKFDSSPATTTFNIAIMGRPFPHELISGDDAVLLHDETGFLAAVIDGLGHGPEARHASNRAVEAITARRKQALDEIAIGVDEDLHNTRGCALTIVRFDKAAGALDCVSLGDVHAHVYKLRDAHFFASTPLIVGTGQFQKRRVRIERKTVDPGSTLVMFTDGLKSKATLKGQLDVLRQPAIAIAEHLLETESRPDDDALVLVARI
jgi:anti-sigma regulatory factor (Ser/Thr protein kinase)